MSSGPSIQNLETEERVLRTRLGELHQQVANITEKLEKLSAQIALRKKSVAVTDHAIVRYMERVHQHDIAALRVAILPPHVEEQVKLLGGTGTFPVGDSHRVAVRNFAVVTVLLED